MAGVTPANPATMPEQVPSMLGLPRPIHSRPAQTRAPAAAPKWVTAKALEARRPAARALPPLNPNQPTQSNVAPMAV